MSNTQQQTASNIIGIAISPQDFDILSPEEKAIWMKANKIALQRQLTKHEKTNEVLKQRLADLEKAITSIDTQTDTK